jgi:adenylosuccinate lyase
VKQEGKPNDLIERIRKDQFFEPILDQLEALMDPSTFIGRSPEIVDEVIELDVVPALQKYENEIGRIGDADLSV